MSSLWSQGLSSESPLAINENGVDAKPACLLDLSESKKACKISELDQMAINQISDCNGAIAYNSDSLRYELGYYENESIDIGSLAINSNSSINYSTSPIDALPYFKATNTGWVDSISIYFKSCNGPTDLELEAYVAIPGFNCNQGVNAIRIVKTQLVNIGQITNSDWNTFIFPNPVPIAENQVFFFVPLFNSCEGVLSSGVPISDYGNLDFLTGCSEDDSTEPAVIYHTRQNIQKWKSIN